MTISKAILMAGAASVAALATPAAYAQADPGEIIVTARKQNESILKVPVIETVLTQQQLESKQVTDLAAIARYVPGLVIGEGVLSIGAQISIRGIGTSSLDAGIDQSVTLNIDGMQFTQGLVYRIGVFDVAQTEVLKGPQALFFGKSSTGGVISLRSADPGDSLELTARAGYETEANHKRIDAIVSAPLSETFGIRLAGLYSKDDGYFRNVAVAAPGFGGKTPTTRKIPNENFIIRGTALWKPSDDFTARLKVNYSEDRTDGSGGGGQWRNCPDGVGRNPINGIPLLGGNEDCRLDRKLNQIWMDPAFFPGIRNGGAPFIRQKIGFGTLELNYNFSPELGLTSVTGYADITQDSLINGVNATSAGPTLGADNAYSRRDLTQELRLASDFDSPLNFTSGIYFQDSRARQRIQVIANAAYRLPGKLVDAAHKMDIEAISAFGQLRWKATPTLEVAAGVRWTDEKREDEVINSTPPPVGKPAPYIVPQAVPKISQSNFSPELTVTYTPTDDLTIFGSLKKAYKSGSFNLTSVPADNGNNSYQDEQVWGGELGLKSRLADRQLHLNLAGYYYKYKDLQVGASEPTAGGVPTVRTLNAGSAETYGVDFDLAYYPRDVEGLALRGAVNWNHARFIKLVGVPCWGGQTIAEGCDQVRNTVTGAFTAQDLSGGYMVRAPAWQMNFGADYEMPVSERLKLKLSSSNRYSSRYLVDLLGRADMFQSGYFQTDASVALSDDKEAWEIAFIGNNLTNKLTTGNCAQLNGEGGQILGGLNTGTNLPRGIAGVDEINCQVGRGRELWLRLTLRPDRL